MIASLTGVVKSVTAQSAVIEVGGVGILVQLTSRHGASLVVGRTASLHTTLLVREDSLTLFGFESIEERALFELLQTVTGIGPKVAQSALSIYESQEIQRAIAQENSGLLEKIPGLGKKGAARLVLELKDKVSATTGSLPPIKSEWRDQLLEALTGLGFTSRESSDAVEIVNEQYPDASDRSLETLLKFALQIRSRK
jgi:Holliday junction DNA helicase RuvA